MESQNDQRQQNVCCLEGESAPARGQCFSGNQCLSLFFGLHHSRLVAICELLIYQKGLQHRLTGDELASRVLEDFFIKIFLPGKFDPSHEPDKHPSDLALGWMLKDARFVLATEAKREARDIKRLLPLDDFVSDKEALRAKELTDFAGLLASFGQHFSKLPPHQKLALAALLEAVEDEKVDFDMGGRWILKAILNRTNLTEMQAKAALQSLRKRAKRSAFRRWFWKN